LFQPGDAKRVTLVSIGGHKIIRGGNGIADGAVDSSQLTEIIQRVTENGFGHEDYLDSRLFSSHLTNGRGEIHCAAFFMAWMFTCELWLQ
jgi:hypothetical protein